MWGWWTLPSYSCMSWTLTCKCNPRGSNQALPQSWTLQTEFLFNIQYRDAFLLKQSYFIIFCIIQAHTEKSNKVIFISLMSKHFIPISSSGNKMVQPSENLQFSIFYEISRNIYHSTENNSNIISRKDWDLFTGLFKITIQLLTSGFFKDDKYSGW